MAELKERQEFLLENTLRSRSRSTTPEIWERLGVDFEALVPCLLEASSKLDRSLFTSFQNGFFAGGALERTQVGPARREQRLPT